MSRPSSSGGSSGSSNAFRRLALFSMSDTTAASDSGMGVSVPSHRPSHRLRLPFALSRYLSAVRVIIRTRNSSKSQTPL